MYVVLWHAKNSSTSGQRSREMGEGEGRGNTAAYASEMRAGHVVIYTFMEVMW